MQYTYHYHFDSREGSSSSFNGQGHHFSPRPQPYSFRLGLILALTAVGVVVIGILYSFHIIPHRQYSNADFGITEYYSSVDHDSDGLDDQSDILISARAYLATNPQYQSIYYATGYPDDNHGVCTDVIAFALKGAGYDLMELIDADIRANPDLYDVEIPDAKIDFRRVKNLAVWFRRHAQNLTTDLKNITEWQGGDIVIFPDHIGIVSDKRNRKGVPFLLHHYSPLQFSYEEDALGRYDIVGHYRLS